MALLMLSLVCRARVLAGRIRPVRMGWSVHDAHWRVCMQMVVHDVHVRMRRGCAGMARGGVVRGGLTN